MTTEDLYNLAIAWCPKKARWDRVFVETYWGPAHELGHALIEPRTRWDKESYGRCSLGHCVCYLQQCHTYEMAAMAVSHTLLVAAGRGDLSDDEYSATDGYDLVDHVHHGRAKFLLKNKKLWPLPKTRPRLEQLLKIKLGRPRGKPLPKSLAPLSPYS